MSTTFNKVIPLSGRINAETNNPISRYGNTLYCVVTTGTTAYYYWPSIMQSTDFGETWTHIPQPPSSGWKSTSTYGADYRVVPWRSGLTILRLMGYDIGTGLFYQENWIEHDFIYSTSGLSSRTGNISSVTHPQIPRGVYRSNGSLYLSPGSTDKSVGGEAYWRPRPVIRNTDKTLTDPGVLTPDNWSRFHIDTPSYIRYGDIIHAFAYAEDNGVALSAYYQIKPDNTVGFNQTWYSQIDGVRKKRSVPFLYEYGSSPKQTGIAIMMYHNAAGSHYLMTIEPADSETPAITGKFVPFELMNDIGDLPNFEKVSVGYYDNHRYFFFKYFNSYLVDETGEFRVIRDNCSLTGTWELFRNRLGSKDWDAITNDSRANPVNMLYIPEEDCFITPIGFTDGIPTNSGGVMKISLAGSQGTQIENQYSLLVDTTSFSYNYTRCNFDSFVNMEHCGFASGGNVGPFNLYNKLFMFAAPSGGPTAFVDVVPVMYKSIDDGDSWDELTLNLSGIQTNNPITTSSYNNRVATAFIYDTGNPNTLKLKLLFGLADYLNNRTAIVVLTFDPITETMVPPGQSGFLPGTLNSTSTTWDFRGYLLGTNRPDGSIVCSHYGGVKSVKGNNYGRTQYAVISTQGVYTDLGVLDDGWGEYHIGGDSLITSQSGLVHVFLRRYQKQTTPSNTWVYYSPIHISLNTNNSWNASTTFPTGIRFLGKPTLYKYGGTTGLFLIANHFSSGSNLLVETAEAKAVPTFQYGSLPTNCHINSPATFIENASVGNRKYIFTKRHSYGTPTGTFSTGEFCVLYADAAPGSTWNFLKYNIGRSGGQYYGQQDRTGTYTNSSCVYMTGCNSNSLGVYVTYGIKNSWLGSGAFIKTKIPPYYIDTNQHAPIESRAAFAGYTINGTGHIPIEYQGIPTYPITGVKKTPIDFFGTYKTYFNNEIDYSSYFIDYEKVSAEHNENIPININSISLEEAVRYELDILNRVEHLSDKNFNLLNRIENISTTNADSKIFSEQTNNLIDINKSQIENICNIDISEKTSIDYRNAKGFKTAVTYFQLPPTGGTCDITINNFGTPKAAILVSVACDPTRTLFSPAGYNSLSYGITDGIKQYCTSNMSRTAIADSDTRCIDSTGHCIYLISTGLLHYGAMTFNSWIDNGIRLNLERVGTTVHTGHYGLGVILLGGDIDLSLDTFIPGTTSGSLVSQYLPFKPNLFIAYGHGQQNYNSAYDNSLFCLGYAYSGSNQTGQYSVSQRTPDAAATSTIAQYFSTNDLFTRFSTSSEALDYRLQIDSIYSTGYQVKTHGTASNAHVFILSINTQGTKCRLNILKSNYGSSAPVDYEVGFRPSTILITRPAEGPGIYPDTVQTTYTDSICIGAADYYNKQFAACIGDDDELATMKTSSWFYRDKCIYSKLGFSSTWSTQDQAYLSNIVCDRFTLRFDSQSASNPFMIYLAIEEPDVDCIGNLNNLEIESSIRAAYPAVNTGLYSIDYHPWFSGTYLNNSFINAHALNDRYYILILNYTSFLVYDIAGGPNINLLYTGVLSYDISSSNYSAILDKDIDKLFVAHSVPQQVAVYQIYKDRYRLLENIGVPGTGSGVSTAGTKFGVTHSIATNKNLLAIGNYDTRTVEATNWADGVVYIYSGMPYGPPIQVLTYFGYVDEIKGKHFGESVSFSNDNKFLVVGAPYFGSGNYVTTNQGLAYIFKYNNGLYEPFQVLNSTNKQSNDLFASEVQFYNDVLYINAYGEPAGGYKSPIYSFKRKNTTETGLFSYIQTLYPPSGIYGYSWVVGEINKQTGLFYNQRVTTASTPYCNRYYLWQGTGFILPSNSNIQATVDRQIIPLISNKYITSLNYTWTFSNFFSYNYNDLNQTSIPISNIYSIPEINYKLPVESRLGEILESILETISFIRTDFKSTVENPYKSFVENKSEFYATYKPLIEDISSQLIEIVELLPIETITILSQYVKSSLELLVKTSEAENISVEELISTVRSNGFPVDEISRVVGTDLLPVECVSKIGDIIFGLLTDYITISLNNYNLRIEKLKDLIAIQKSSFENTSSLFNISNTPIGFISKLYDIHTISIEYLAQALTTGKVLVEKLGQVLNLSKLTTEQLVSMSTYYSVTLENLKRVDITRKPIISILRDIFNSDSIPIDLLGQELITILSKLPLENIKSLLFANKWNIESVLSTSKFDKLLVEMNLNSLNTNKLLIENIGSELLTFLKLLPIETIGRLSSVSKNPLDFISTYYDTKTISVEGLINAIRTEKILIEKLGQIGTLEQVVNVAQLPIEYLVELTNRHGFSAENLERINISNNTVIDILRNVSQDGRIPLDTLGAALVTAIGNLPIDYIGGLLFGKNFEIESSLTIERFSKLFTEDLRQTDTLKTLPVGYLNNITLSNELPVSQLLKLSKDRSTPIDILLYLPSIDSICKIEVNIRSSIIRELYVDIAGGAILRLNSVVPLDFKTGFDIKRSASIEQLLNLVASSVSAVGFSEGVLLADSVPISWSYDLSLTNKILTELAGINTIIIGNHINVDFLSNIYLDRNTLIEALEAIQPLGYGTFIETLNGVNRNTRVPLSFLGISSAIKALKWVLNSRSSSWTLDEQDNIWTF